MKNRINLQFGETEMDQLKEIAEDKETTVNDVVRRAVRLAIQLHKIEKRSPESVVIVHEEGGVDRHILII